MIILAGSRSCLCWLTMVARCFARLFSTTGMIGSLEDIKWEIGNQFDVIYVSIDPQETSGRWPLAKKTILCQTLRAVNQAAQGWHFLTGDGTGH